MIMGLYSQKAQSGKSVCADALKDDGWEVAKFAGPLYAMLFGLLRYFGYSWEEIDRFRTVDKEKVISGFGYSVRQFMQKLGTDFGRDCLDEDIWIRSIEKKLKTIDTNKIVIDDLRFPNEYEWIKAQGGKTIKIVRGESEDSKHASEGALDEMDFDHTIENNGTIEELQSEICAIARSIEKEPREAAEDPSAV